MLELQSFEEIQKKIRRRSRANKKLVNPQSHVQKKYFSLMLVPSYTSGKTRSIRIPHVAFHLLFFILAATCTAMLILHLRAQSLVQTVQYTAESLEQVQEAYVSLQEISEEERRRLIEDSVALRSALTQERVRGIEEQYQQRQTYLETLDSIQLYVENLEQQLQQFEIYRQEILDQLSASSHIPPVRNILNEMHQSQMHLLATLSDLSDYSAFRRERAAEQTGTMLLAYPSMLLASSAEDVAEELFEYIAILELTLEAKVELYSQLEREVRRIAPYIRNYPTIRPVNGRLTSGFGWRRNPMGGGGSEMHRGIDIAAPTGTPIRATGGGIVVFSGWSGAFGNKVIIDHGMGLRTLYAHNSANLVHVNQRVARGEIIARVGSTGQSTGPHVHYETILNGVAVNPAQFFLE